MYQLNTNVHTMYVHVDEGTFVFHAHVNFLLLLQFVYLLLIHMLSCTQYLGEYLIGGHFVSVVYQNTCFDVFSLNLIVTQQYQSNLSYSKKLFTQYDI